MVVTAQQVNGTVTRARAVAGFYRGGELVQPGAILDLPRHEFLELRMYRLVEEAPAVEEVQAEKKLR